MANKFRRWQPRGGSNPTRLEQRIAESLKDQPPSGNVKIFNAEEIAKYEKELKERFEREKK